MNALIVVVEDGDVGGISMLLSDETGLPMVRRPAPAGVLPVANADEGIDAIRSLMEEAPARLVVVMGRTTWEELRGRVPPIDMARLLMRVGLRVVRGRGRR